MQQSFTNRRLLVYWFILMFSLAHIIPGLSQGYIDDGKRYAMFALYHYGDSDGTMQQRQINSMKDAFANGCNAVSIGIAWDILQPTLNSAPNWAYIDRFVKVAQEHNVKIAIRLRTCRQDRTGFWPEEQTMRDARGKVMDAEGAGHTRLGYTPAIDKIQDFVRSVAQRYKYLNDRGDLLFMSVTFNPQWENEYWHTNYPDQNETSYDYNPLTITDFQRWTIDKYNGSLDAVNRAWNTNYQAVTDIQPTYPNVNNQYGYQGKRGQDWYVFRHIQLKGFNDRFARTVKTVDPTMRVVVEQGSVYDANSANRGTLGFKSLSESFDGVKINDAPEYVHQFSMDLLRSNSKPGGWIINEIDGIAFLDPRGTELLANQIENSFKYGAKIITFANYFLEFNQEGQLRELLAGMRAKRLLDQPVPTITPVATMTYKMSTLVQSNIYESNILGQWNTLRGGSEQKPVRILLDEDLLAGITTVQPNQVPTVVNGVPDQIATLNKSFSYKIPDNTFADADGQIAGVTVSGLPTGLSYDAASRTISGTAVSVGSKDVTVVATDNNNATVTDSFVLAVQNATLPLRLLDPVLDCTTGRFEFRSTDGDGSTVEYAADNLFTWNTQKVYTLAEQFRTGSTLTIRARQGGKEIVLSYTTTCSAAGANKPPVVSMALADQSVTAGQNFSTTLPANTFSDPDGSIASVSVSGLPGGISYTPATRVIAGTASSVGTWTVTVTATDNLGASVSTSFKLTVGTTPVNKAPVVSVPVGDQAASVNKSLSISIPEGTFTDTDGQVVSVSVSGLPVGLSYDRTTRLITGTVSTVGVSTVTVVATDDKGASVSTTFVITVNSGANPLRLLSPVLDCSTGRFEFRSADGDGSPVEYSIDRLVVWTTQTSFTLAAGMRSNQQLDIKARQNGQLYQSVYYTNCSAESIANKPPVVSVALSDQSVTAGQNFSTTVSANTFSDPDGSIASVSVSGLPAGISYTPATRVIAGTASSVGTWTVTVTATDNLGASVSTSFKLRVIAAPALQLLTPVLNCVTGLFEFRSTGGDGSPIEYSIDRLVAWSTQTSFTLAAVMRNNEQLDIKARQNGQIVQAVYYTRCTAANNQLPTVKTVIPNQVLTQFLNMSLVIPSTNFNDVDGVIEQIVLTGLPPGLTYTANTRTMSGAPTTTGSWTLTATATDNWGGTVSTTFVVSVTAQQAKPLRLLAPVIDCKTGRLEFQTADGNGSAIEHSIDQILAWTTQSVYTLAEGPRFGTVLTLRVRQSGVEQTLSYTTPCSRSNVAPIVANLIPDQVMIANQPASVTLSATTFADPDGTISSVTLTGLPVGLSYEPTTRIISGTPTLIGSSPVIAIATDNAGASVSDTFMITVRAASSFTVATTLLDTQGKVLKNLADGDRLDSKSMPLLANLSCQPKSAAGSVLMELSGPVKRTVYANAAPYLLYPSGQGFKPVVGSYKFKVSVYSGANGTGTLLGVSNIKFDIFE